MYMSWGELGGNHDHVSRAERFLKRSFCILVVLTCTRTTSRGWSWFADGGGRGHETICSPSRDPLPCARGMDAFESILGEGFKCST